MELYLFRHDQWERLYNCARINVDDVPFQQRFHPLNGTLIVAMFLVFEVLYVPCICAIYKHREHSCYKLLFYIGIADIAMLFIHGLETGVFSFTGEVFCSNPHFNFVTGSIAAGLFAMETSANIILALDRCADSFSPSLAKLFTGNRIFIWIGISLLTSAYYFFYVNPGLYSGIYMNWFMIPYQGYPVKVDFNDYINPASVWYGMFLTFGFPTIYFLFIVLFLIRLRETRALQNSGQRKWKISMFCQVTIIIGLNVTSSLLFAIMQEFPMSTATILVEYYVNYFVFGFPPLIYLFFNKTIRMECRKMLGNFLFGIAVKVYYNSTNVQNLQTLGNTVGGNGGTLVRQNNIRSIPVQCPQNEGRF